MNEPSEPFDLDARGLRLVTPEALWAVEYDAQEFVRVMRFHPATLELEVRSERIAPRFHDAAIDPSTASSE